MKILYLSCHEILGYDDAKLLFALGHQVFSPGAAVCGENRGDNGLRPLIEKCENYDYLMQEWHKLGKEGLDNKENISLEFVKNFDLVIVVHIDKWISSNWEAYKKSGVPIVLRTIGQNWSKNEKTLLPFRKEGLKIIRYSPREERIPDYIGGDALIRFYKDEDEFNGWIGDKLEISVFGQDLEKRGQPCGFEFLKELTEPFPRAFIGPGTETLSYGKGRYSYDAFKDAMKHTRVAGYAGTWPASTTLSFQELALTSVPMACVGEKLGNPGWFPDHFLYEVGDIIKHGENGFISDDIRELHAGVAEVLKNDKLAEKISKNIRATGLKLFSKATIKPQWENFLNQIK